MSQPLHRDFVRFQSALTAAADEWRPLSEEEVVKRTMTPYQFMGHTVIERIANTDTGGEIHAKLLNDNTVHGALVLSRYCNIAALVANREGMDETQLGEALNNQASFDTVASIAGLQDAVAIKVENHIGVRGYYTESELVKFKLSHWALNSAGGIIVPNIEAIKKDSIEKVRKKGELDLTQKHECSALSNRMLDKIYQQFIRICMDDPLLFDRTLSVRHHFPAVANAPC